MTQQAHRWQGKSGIWYTYYVYPIPATLYDVPANYILARARNDGKFDPLYIGQTENLKERITTSHEKWGCVSIYGVTHVHAHINSRSADRIAEEHDLIQSFRPPCNS